MKNIFCINCAKIVQIMSKKVQEKNVFVWFEIANFRPQGYCNLAFDLRRKNSEFDKKIF